MKLKDILCAEIFQEEVRTALRGSYGKRSISDINAVGGAEFEISLCKAINRVLPDGHVCLTKKAINEDYRFPEDFMKTIESDAFHPYSASDLFVFDADNNFIDAVSLKTAMSEGNPKPFLHNDPNNQVYDLVSSLCKESKAIGQVFIVTYNIKTSEVESYYYDQTVKSLTSVFEDSTENKHGDLIYSGEHFGINRQVLKITNRNSTTRKAQSSFNRGVVLDGAFIKDVLVPRGIIENPHSFTLHHEEIKLQSINELTLGRR